METATIDPGPSPGLELRGLSRRFGDTVALDDLSFTVQPGQMFGFVGPNGAGKTTAMRIVLGVLTPDAGDVRWKGRPVDADVRRRFGYMPEERGLYPKMKVGDQLAYFARLHGADATAAKAEAARWMERLGVAGRAGDRVEDLSLGNQQRVQLAAALVQAPELLVLDEPFSGLDPVGVDVLSEVLLDQVRGGTPVIFSSHQLELVERLCDAVAIVNGGRVVASGPVAELRRRGRRQLAVVVEGEGEGAWLQGLEGVHVRRTPSDQHGWLLELDDGIDDQVVLDAARAVGPVRRFTTVEPTLTDLFREAVEA